MAGKVNFGSNEARESWDRLSEWGRLRRGPCNETLIEFYMEYFGYATERLRKEGTPAMPYFMPKVSRIEHISLQDIKTLIEITKDSRLVEVLEEAKGGNRLIAAPISLLSEDERWEIDVIMKKWPLDILGAYDGKEIFSGLDATMSDIWHELNHRLRHQSIGRFEIPIRYRNQSASQILNATNAPTHIVEFFGELERIIGENAGFLKYQIPRDSHYNDIAEGLERAVQYFSPSCLGKARKITTSFIQSLRHLADDAPSESEATKDSAIRYSDAVTRAAVDAYNSIEEFEAHGKYAALIENVDVRAIESAMSIAGGLAMLLIRHATIRQAAWLHSYERYAAWLDSYEPSAHMKKIKGTIDTVIPTLQQFRSNLDTEIEMRTIPVAPMYNSSIPYVLADIAIAKRFEDLRINWPQVFFMPAAQVGEIYFKDVIAEARKARADYLKAKAEVTPLIIPGRD